MANPENPAPTTKDAQKPTAPDLLIVVDKPTQIMTVTVDGHVRYRRRVSTGATHFSTPAGSYTPFRMKLMYYSRRDNWQTRNKEPALALMAYAAQEESRSSHQAAKDSPWFVDG
jgi:lipoprotein-anchoring transpeptidase ErfK/SrfK